ncbi:MAG: protein-L-isoaspartate O-methyltransferase [Campylobacteraceae bacterium]|nr:protein-L-isoaspartate O-methyltransferase [Campylobacteraceae bacterium]
MENLIENMKVSGALKSPEIIDAFKAIDRKFFVPENFKEHIYIDKPLPIGKNQTISQPTTVAFMLELLSPKKGDEVLDIGSGSGWTTALLCQIVTKSGSVLGLERVDELVKIGQKNLSQFDFGTHCNIKKAKKELGMPGVLFDKILVSASAKEIPKVLFEQLKEGGALVIPIRNSIVKFKKISQTKITQEEFPGFVFVPLIIDNELKDSYNLELLKDRI